MPPALHVGPILLFLLLSGHAVVSTPALGLRLPITHPQQQQQAAQELPKMNTTVGNIKWAIRQLDAPEDSDGHRRSSSSSSADVSECILLFGAFCNGECEENGLKEAQVQPC